MAAALRSTEARIPFDRAVQVGANDYVKKPFSRDEVARPHPRMAARRHVAPQRELAPLVTATRLLTTRCGGRQDCAA